MNILVYHWDIYPYDDIIQTFQKQGHSVDVPAFSAKNHLRDEQFEQAFMERLKQNPYDFVFSVNYFPVISIVCHQLQIPYVSWTVDTPLISMQTPTILYPENRIFTFDKNEWVQLRKKGVTNSYHLPLAGSTVRFPAASEEIPPNYQYPVSFVGNLYDKNRYDEMCRILPDYLCGYMDAAIEAQLHISCGNLFPVMLSGNIFQELKPYLHLEKGYDSCFYPDLPHARKNCSADTDSINQREDWEDIHDALLKLQFTTRVLSHKAASLIRIRTLNQLARKYPVHLFTTSDTSPLLHVHTHPALDYHTQMSKIFSVSKINLNMTAPNIESGIPLRVWDVLSAGGFLLTDYRPEYDGLLEDGYELVIYDGLEDLIQKIHYYLTHEEERLQIARNGYQRILQEHNYQNRLEKMLCTI